jgi:hypothetical protein
MAFNSEGDHILVGEGEMVYLIDAGTGNEIKRVPTKTAATSLSFSPEGNLFAAASLKVIQLWDITKISDIESDRLRDVACSRLYENFSQDQWTAFFGDEKYEPTLLCPD